MHTRNTIGSEHIFELYDWFTLATSSMPGMVSGTLEGIGSGLYIGQQSRVFGLRTAWVINRAISGYSWVLSIVILFCMAPGVLFIGYTFNSVQCSMAWRTRRLGAGLHLRPRLKYYSAVRPGLNGIPNSSACHESVGTASLYYCVSLLCKHPCQVIHPRPAPRHKS